jgi:hypothetical protein
VSDTTAQILEIVRNSLDSKTTRLIEEALKNSDRIAIIRDAFLEGRDLEAVKMIRDLDPVGIRRILGCGTQGREVPARGSAQIMTRPQLPFTPNRFIVSRGSYSFLIADIKVGNRSMWVQAGDIDADLFANDAPIFEGERDADGFLVIKISAQVESRLGIPIDMPEVLPGQEITVVIHNASDEDQTFNGAFLGTTRIY